MCSAPLSSDATRRLRLVISAKSDLSCHTCSLILSAVEFARFAMPSDSSTPADAEATDDSRLSKRLGSAA